MHAPSLLLALLVFASSPLRPMAAEGPPAHPAPASAHGADAPPIDCPLHGGEGTAGLKPFAESEKYIEFLERADRAKWQRPDDVVAALRLQGSETLADVGAGSGYFTFRFAKALPRGKVVATDVDREMVRHIHHKLMTEGIGNVQVLLGEPGDPRVAPEADVVFVCDVLHHVEGREAWLRKLSSEMKPGARLVVIEFKEGKLPEGPPEAVKVPKAKLTAMIRDAGLTLRSDDPELLPYQTFLVFEKAASAPARERGPTR